ncbi:MAG: hypothetical protein ACK57V_17950 [Pirellula sp.]
MYSLFIPFLLCFQSTSAPEDVGLFTKALWLFHATGEPNCTVVDNDSKIKTAVAKAIAKDREISVNELDGLMTDSTFAKLAGKDGRISEAEITKALDSMTPPSRLRLHDSLRKHAELLTTSFDMIEQDHRPAIQSLAKWIANQSNKQESLHVIVTCTGNSRRSMMGASMGNLAAAYYGMEHVHFHSGGTSPTAFNRRTIASLKEIGFQIEPTGQLAEPGDPQTPNPKYRVVWGKDFETEEFSKMYNDGSNPRSGFAAIMVCSEADQDCPIVKGASIRLAMPFIDPKLYDDGSLEGNKYRERRDDIGRTMMAIMAHASRNIEPKSDKAPPQVGQFN